jgi:hypothetical protein
VASDEEILYQVLTPEQHIAAAERYVNTLPAILADHTSRFVQTNQTDVALMDVYLHAADVHLKLAEAKWRMLPPKVAPLPHPSSKGQPSQIELLGG